MLEKNQTRTTLSWNILLDQQQRHRNRHRSDVSIIMFHTTKHRFSILLYYKFSYRKSENVGRRMESQIGEIEKFFFFSLFGVL